MNVEKYVVLLLSEILENGLTWHVAFIGPQQIEKTKMEMQHRVAFHQDIHSLISHKLLAYLINEMGLVARKPVFGVFVEARLKAVYSATETSWKIEISPVASLHMLLSKKRITKVMIRLCRCTGWYVSLLLANPRRQVFSRRGPNYLEHLNINNTHLYIIPFIKLYERISILAF